MTNTLAAVSVSPVVPADEPTLRAIYRATRHGELAGIGWPDAAITAFCDQQYDLQQAHYRQAYPDADHRLVVVDDEPIGRLITHRGADAHTLVDIALLTEHRGRGIGEALLRTVIDRADDEHVPLDLTVTHDNPARRLYERLGFGRTGADDLHLFLRRDPIERTRT